MLRVSDSGCGIADVSKALQTFSSICNAEESKDREGFRNDRDDDGENRGMRSGAPRMSALSRIGKYGVGLSSVFIYSQARADFT